MNRVRKRLRLVAASSIACLLGSSLSLAFPFAIGASGPLSGDFGTALRSELQRLRSAVAEEGSADLNRARRITRALERATAALDADDPYLGLHHLAGARIEVEHRRYLNALDEVGDLEEIARLCREEEKRRAETATAQGTRGNGAVAVRALVEASHGRASRYYTSAPVQGAETRLSTGRYYLASARSHESLARFAAGLPVTKTGMGSTAPALPGLRGVLDRLGAELTEVYKPPLAIDKHAVFIEASASLKFANQLFEEGARFGALDLGLEASTLIGRLRDLPPPDLAELEERIEEHRDRLAAAQVDHSLGRVFLSRAEDELARVARGESNASAKAVAIVLDETLPQYFDGFDAAALAAAGGAPTEPSVTVTLVRWPFT